MFLLGTKLPLNSVEPISVKTCHSNLDPLVYPFHPHIQNHTIRAKGPHCSDWSLSTQTLGILWPTSKRQGYQDKIKLLIGHEWKADSKGAISPAHILGSTEIGLLSHGPSTHQVSGEAILSLSVCVLSSSADREQGPRGLKGGCGRCSWGMTGWHEKSSWSSIREATSYQAHHALPVLQKAPCCW